MSIKASVVSVLSALTVLLGLFAVYSTFSTFGPVAAGTGDATGTGIAASSVSWTLTLAGLVTTTVAFFRKWQPLAQTVINATTNNAVAPTTPSTVTDTVTDGFSAVAAIVAWKRSPDDKGLERAALMAILTLADDLVGAKYPAAKDNLNALGHTVIEALFPTSVQPVSPVSSTESAIDAVVAAALAKIATVQAVAPVAGS